MKGLILIRLITLTALNSLIIIWYLDWLHIYYEMGRWSLGTCKIKLFHAIQNYIQNYSLKWLNTLIVILFMSQCQKKTKYKFCGNVFHHTITLSGLWHQSCEVHVLCSNLPKSSYLLLFGLNIYYMFQHISPYLSLSILFILIWETLIRCCEPP